MKKLSNVPTIKPIKKLKNDWHTNAYKKGMGDNYGTGIKAKIGKMIDGVGFNDTPKSKLKNPPKNLA